MAKKVRFLIAEPKDEVYSNITTSILPKKIKDGNEELEVEYSGCDSVQTAVSFCCDNNPDFVLYNIDCKFIAGSSFESEEHVKMFLLELSGLNKDTKVILYTRGKEKVVKKSSDYMKLNILNKGEMFDYLILDYDNFNFMEDLNKLINNYYKFKKDKVNFDYAYKYLGVISPKNDDKLKYNIYKFNVNTGTLHNQSCSFSDKNARLYFIVAKEEAPYGEIESYEQYFIDSDEMLTEEKGEDSAFTEMDFINYLCNTYHYTNFESCE